MLPLRGTVELRFAAPMKVLIDECAPKALKIFLSKQGHECLTVQEAGWSGRQNGELLNLREAGFDVLVCL